LAKNSLFWPKSDNEGILFHWTKFGADLMLYNVSHNRPIYYCQIQSNLILLENAGAFVHMSSKVKTDEIRHCHGTQAFLKKKPGVRLSRFCQA